MFLFDPLYEEIVTSSSDLMNFVVRHVFFELVLPLSIFFSVMLTLFLDWSWIPISNVDRKRGVALENLKKQLLE
tara:strand:- start:890 stop:1111 length:222 start_codon:yes stop_codon:yes gene_type:complete